MEPKVVVKNLYKIFGNNPNSALELLKKGEDKDTIFIKPGRPLASVTPVLKSIKARYSSLWACQVPASQHWSDCLID